MATCVISVPLSSISLPTANVCHGDGTRSGMPNMREKPAHAKIRIAIDSNVMDARETIRRGSMRMKRRPHFFLERGFRLDVRGSDGAIQIGRASCRERV